MPIVNYSVPPMGKALSSKEIQGLPLRNKGLVEGEPVTFSYLPPARRWEVGKYGSKGDKSREERNEDKKESKNEEYEDVKEAEDEDGEDIKKTKEDDDNKSSSEKAKGRKSGGKVDKGKLLKGLLRVLDKNLR